MVWHRRVPVAALLALVAVQGLAAQSQPATAAKASAETFDAARVFEKIAGAAEAGMLMPRAIGSVPEEQARTLVEKQVATFHLSEETRFQPPLSWGGVWTGQSATGFVVLKILSPVPVGNNSTDLVDLFFAPMGELVIPQAVLSHLLSTAQKTRVGADTLELEFAAEQPSKTRPCVSWTVLTVRLTGALVSNNRKISCEVPRN